MFFKQLKTCQILSCLLVDLSRAVSAIGKRDIDIGFISATRLLTHANTISPTGRRSAAIGFPPGHISSTLSVFVVAANRDRHRGQVSLPRSSSVYLPLSRRHSNTPLLSLRYRHVKSRRTAANVRQGPRRQMPTVAAGKSFLWWDRGIQPLTYYLYKYGDGLNSPWKWSTHGATILVCACTGLFIFSTSTCEICC